MFTIYTDICSRCLRELWPKMFGSPAEIWPLWLHKSADTRCDLFYRYLNVVVITLPLSSRICECLVPNFDPGSDSPDSRNVPLVLGCVLFHFILVYSRYLWLVYVSFLNYCLTAWILLTRHFCTKLLTKISCQNCSGTSHLVWVLFWLPGGTSWS